MGRWMDFREAHNSSSLRGSTSPSQNSVQKDHTEQIVVTSKFLAEVSIPICPYLAGRTHVGVLGAEASEAGQGE